jgi:uncharacterized FlaG/YvyC family protein
MKYGHEWIQWNEKIQSFKEIRHQEAYKETNKKEKETLNSESKKMEEYVKKIKNQVTFLVGNRTEAKDRQTFQGH